MLNMLDQAKSMLFPYAQSLSLEKYDWLAGPKVDPEEEREAMAFGQVVQAALLSAIPFGFASVCMLVGWHAWRPHVGVPNVKQLEGRMRCLAFCRTRRWCLHNSCGVSISCR